MQTYSFERPPYRGGVLLDMLKDRMVDPQKLLDFVAESLAVARTCNAVVLESMGETDAYFIRELDLNRIEMFSILLKGVIRREEINSRT